MTDEEDAETAAAIRPQPTETRVRPCDHEPESSDDGLGYPEQAFLQFGSRMLTVLLCKHCRCVYVP